MDYMLDTNAVSDLIREDARLDQRAKELNPGDRLIIIAIVRGELKHGLNRLPHGKRRAELEAKTAIILKRMVAESISSSVGEQYAELKIMRELQGLPLNENDLWIAATAIALKATLVTRDSDFDRIKGLTVEDWTV